MDGQISAQPIASLRPTQLKHTDSIEVYESPPELMTLPKKRKVSLKPETFFQPSVVGEKKSKKNTSNEPYLIIGFDTEFKTPDYMVSRDEIVAGIAKYRVLSYQFHAKTSDGQEWQGICCPDGDERMSLGAFLVFALGLGAEDHGFTDLPTKIYLVGHFTRADIPAFADFQTLTGFLSNVRNTFISIDMATPLQIDHADGSPSTSLSLLFRDTLLLTPQASRSLKEIGKLVGHPKLELDDDPVKHKEMIRNMDRVRTEHWDIFRKYALNDATICVRYIESVIAQFEEVTGSKKVPVTLTSIGIELLLNTWRDRIKLDPLAVLGKEVVEHKFFDKKKGYYRKQKLEVDIEQVSWHLNFVTESYHGGRNEQFWFGPGFEDVWTDFDLSSAYPTAMSLIGLPSWRDIREEFDVTKFTVTTLGFANVTFEFPPDTRYPTLPVRTSHGLVFPLKGVSYCSSPELVVALNLGAKITINRGVVVPCDTEIRIFGEFIKECLDHRKTAGSKTLRGLFWKEISNSTYGKTAQGLREKRVFDMRDKTTKELPPSRITNPFFASYITSFTRAVLGEVINNLNADTCVFSCTTDGFLTNATDNEVESAQQGFLCNTFKEARKDLTGVGSVLEKKHVTAKPLGWRTRGQATLMAGEDPDNDDSFNVVLAKGGIFTPPEFETVTDQNAEIVRTFFDRTPDTMVRVEGKTGVRDMVYFDADLVEKVFSKRLNMEYDWKRRPDGVGISAIEGHLIFSTRAWDTVDQFDMVREAWEGYTKERVQCLKTSDDFDAFSSHVEIHSFMSADLAKYMKRKGSPDIDRLRQMLCSAWRQSLAGLVWRNDGMSASEFADVLTSHGIPCKKTDVENGKNKLFVPKACPPTALVVSLLEALLNEFPLLDIDMFLYRGNVNSSVNISARLDCPMVAKATGLTGSTVF